MLTLHILFFYYFIILSIISPLIKFLPSEFWARTCCLAFIVLWKITTPTFWFPSKHLYFVCLFTFEGDSTKYLLILFYNFARKPYLNFWVSTVLISDKISIFIFSIQPPPSLWYFLFLWWFVDIVVTNGIYTIDIPRIYHTSYNVWRGSQD